jgi:hypothetical protein
VKLPVLVDCEPYGARLMESMCVKRYANAQTINHSGKGVPRGNTAIRNGIRRAALSFCADCKVGAKRTDDAELEATG